GLPALLSLSYLPEPSAAPIYPLSLHDALPICCRAGSAARTEVVLARSKICQEAISRMLSKWGVVEQKYDSSGDPMSLFSSVSARSEEHTSELQSRENLVCRLLLEKKNDTESEM